MASGLRIAFMGTPDFAAAALRALIPSAHEIACVYTQPPRAKGRGQAVRKSPVHLLAEENGLPVRCPVSLKSKDAQADFAALDLDVAVVAAYGLILPKPVLDAPRHGCLNIHGSLLPRWRGAAPIQRAIEAGDTETGITIMQMDEGLDTGPMIAMEKLPITPDTGAQGLHDDMAALGARMIVTALDRLAAEGKLDAAPQPEDGMTYAAMLKKEEGNLNWTESAATLDRRIRAFTPWPGTYTFLPGGKRLKILSARPDGGGSGGNPGTVLDAEGRIACGEGSALRLLSVQPEGKKPMGFADLVHGGRVTTGDTLQSA